MTADGSLDYCNGCAVMGSRRINLPEGWSEGDPLPLGLTVHQTPRERANGNKPFAFIGDPAHHLAFAIHKNGALRVELPVLVSDRPAYNFPLKTEQGVDQMVDF